MFFFYSLHVRTEMMDMKDINKKHDVKVFKQVSNEDQ